MPYTLVVIKYQGSPSEAAAETEEWNGSAWWEVNDLITARSGTGVGTTREAALLVGGDSSWKYRRVEWNKLVRSCCPAQMTYVCQPYFHSIGGGGGTVNDAHVYGGYINGSPYRQLNSLLYDGTAWSQDASLNTVRRYASGRGSTSGNVIALGGSNNLKATETYTLTVY